MTRLRLDWTDAAPWLYTLAMFALWELVVRVFGVPQFILPAPSRILEAIVQYWPAIWKNSLQTLYTTMVGFVFGRQVEQAALAGWGFASVILLVVMVAGIAFAWWRINRLPISSYDDGRNFS